MKKLQLFLLFIGILPLVLSAQERTKIYVDRFERGTVENKTKISYLRKPVFRQDNAILTCDSAVFYEARNVFEAYNNVHINQADTLNIYSDRLTYDGNTKIAHLTSRVRMLDQQSVLTTNNLDYNLGTRIGTYVNGGKIVNKDVTLTSRNGFYFANSRDAFFRYNVVVVTPQVNIKSDTLRYNTLTNWTYFYGPTNIKGKEDNLYTENGAYNTKTEYAYFGKKNLYTTGSKSLKGDSLYYDGIAGYGKAVRNIVFTDTTDKTVMHGQLGYYYKEDQRTIVTKNAYVGLGTKDSIEVNKVKRPDSLWLGADTLETQVVLRSTLKLLPLPVIQKDNELGEVQTEGGAPDDSSITPTPSMESDSVQRQPVKVEPLKPAPTTAPDSVAVAAQKAPDKKLSRKEQRALKKNPPIAAPATPVDTIQKAVVVTDSLATDTATNKKPVEKPKGTTAKKAGSTLKTAIPAAPVNPADTAKARMIKAYHNVRVFKSNLQAKADSLFYTSADSTLRWFNNPMMWAEGSQQTGDTIYLQLRDRRINSVQVIRNAFTVNVYKDSTRFNQVKGKLMTGFFKEGKLHTMYVDGNAESVYFNKTDSGEYDKMNRTISSRIKVLFRNDEMNEIVAIKDVEGTTTPAKDVKEDITLTGFIWKPELRPRSKRDIINPPKAKSAGPAKKPVKKSVPAVKATAPVKKK